MRRAAIVSLAGLALLVTAPVGYALAESSSLAVKVSPARGGRHTRFHVSFVTPSALGRGGILDRTDTVSVAGPRRQRCRAAQSRVLSAAAPGAEVSVTLSPSAQGWCAGHFRGAIVAYQAVVCRQGEMCPQFMVAPQTIARFAFTVTRHAA